MGREMYPFFSEGNNIKTSRCLESGRDAAPGQLIEVVILIVVVVGTHDSDPSHRFGGSVGSEAKGVTCALSLGPTDSWVAERLVSSALYE